MPNRLFALFLVIPLTLWTACGGSSSGGSSNSGGGGGGGGTGGGAVNPPVVVSVAAGQTASGVSITVPAPASSPTPNATAAGANGSTATSSGDTMHRSSSLTVLVFGTGLTTGTGTSLTPNVKASFSGPSDITIGPLQAVTFQPSGTGVSFTATVAPNAALGARTLILQNANNDITTFTGGLEVVP